MKDRQTDRLLGQLPWELGLAELSQNGQVGLAIWSWLATLSVSLAFHRLGLVGQLSASSVSNSTERERAAIFRPTQGGGESPLTFSGAVWPDGKVLDYFHQTFQIGCN